MSDIVHSVEQVTALISDISQSTRRETSGIDQIGNSVADLDQTTQQNAALVEQSAAAADSLRQQAARLLEAVDVFRLKSQFA
jgi:aerotaxis receptor